MEGGKQARTGFPFLFGGTFIEGTIWLPSLWSLEPDFPSFSEGLSLRGEIAWALAVHAMEFPFLFGGTFIEGFAR